MHEKINCPWGSHNITTEVSEPYFQTKVIGFWNLSFIHIFLKSLLLYSICPIPFIITDSFPEPTKSSEILSLYPYNCNPKRFFALLDADCIKV